MPLILLMFTSSETQPIVAQDILDILTVAYKRNTAANITGRLLYRGGYFMQALEGEEAVVKALYQDIVKDSRHRIIWMLYKTIDQRSFDDWAMSFDNFEEIAPTTLPGYTDFLAQPFAPEMLSENNRAKSLLELFKESHY